MKPTLTILSVISAFLIGCLFMHHLDRPRNGSAYEVELYYTGYLDGMHNQITNQGCDTCLKEGMKRDTAEFGDWINELN